jgi:serine/threonine protein kinase
VAPGLKLIDFGISQHGPESFPYRDVADSEPETQLMGTPAYMAPERILDLPTTDQRSDIWSLGVVLHEPLTAHSLFGREDIVATCTSVVRHRFELEANGAVLPSALRIVVARCLARHPAHRFQGVQELAHALRNAITLPERSWGLLTGKFHRPVTTQRGAPSVSSAAHPWGPAPLPAAPDAQPRRSSSFGRGGRRRWTLLSLALSSVALLGIAVSELVGAWRFGETQPVSGESRSALLGVFRA